MAFPLRYPIIARGGIHTNAADTLPNARLVFVDASADAKGIGVATLDAFAVGEVLGMYTGRIIVDPRSPGSLVGIRSAYVVDVHSPLDRRATASTRPVFAVDAENAMYNADLPSVTVSVDVAVNPLTGARVAREFTFSTADQQANWTRYINSINPGEPKHAQNCAMIWNERTGFIEITATRNIVSGEELLLNYGDTYFVAALEQSTAVIQRDRQAFADTVRAFDAQAGADVYRDIQNMFTTLTELRDADGGWLGVMVSLGATAYHVFTIDVRNSDAIVRELLAILYEDSVVSERRYVYARSSVFERFGGNADVFGFEAVGALRWSRLNATSDNDDVGVDVDETVLSLYRRPVAPIEVRYATDDDLLWFSAMVAETACPELQQYTFPSRRGAGRRGVASMDVSMECDFFARPPRQSLFRLLVATAHNLYVGVAVVAAYSTSKPFLDYVCAFDQVGRSELVQTHVLYKLINFYERLAYERTMTARIHIPKQMASLLTNGTNRHLSEYKRPSNKRVPTQFQSSKQDLLFYERDRNADVH